MRIKTVPGRAAGLAAVLGTVAACSGSGNGGHRSLAALSTPAPRPSPSSPSTTSGPGPSGSSGSTASGATRAVGKPATSPTNAGSGPHPAPAQPLATQSVKGDKIRYVVRIWAERAGAERCYRLAHGQPVISYLIAHPCRSLTRVLATTEIHGRSVGLAESVLTFTGAAPGVYKTAEAFRKLVLRDGTGDVDDLVHEGYRLPDRSGSIPSPNAFAALNQDAGVSIFELWYLDGTTPMNDPTLEQAAQDLFLRLH